MKDKRSGLQRRKGGFSALAANGAKMREAQLEGPGAEKRLQRIQRRFRRLEVNHPRQAAHQQNVGLIVLSLTVFVAVVAASLISIYLLPAPH